MAGPLALALKALFSILGCIMVATLIYTISIDGLPFRKELLTPWMVATLIDFYINVVPIGIWIVYKEANWITAILWSILLVCLGSITTCVYIVLQLRKLSPIEALQDPMYHALLRNRNQTRVGLPNNTYVMLAKVIFGILGCLMLGTLIYTILSDGSPFRRELLTPWMVATLIDFYINTVALSVWIAYKERPLWLSAVVWIILLVCFGSITTCVYIVRQLLDLAPFYPFHLIFFE